jgi:hypothetical protein
LVDLAEEKKVNRKLATLLWKRQRISKTKHSLFPREKIPQKKVSQINKGFGALGHKGEILRPPGGSVSQTIEICSLCCST